MVKKIFPILILAAGFAYFVARDRQKPLPATPSKSPEDVLIDMVQAMGTSNVPAWLDCFGGELGRRLRDLVNQQGNLEIRRLLKERNQLVKGFAIVDKQPRDPETVLVFTETVYADKNTRQSFLLREENNRWKIFQSDSEMVSAWDTKYGKSIREEN
jgi:hypothetical protein